MTYEQADPRLQLGYLMQTGAPDLSITSGPQLHVTAVIKGLQQQGHHVRTVAFQDAALGWSDCIPSWNAPTYGVTERRWYRLSESIVRRTQSEAGLPFIGLFDSIRYADACVQMLSGYDLLYERHGYMGYGGVLAARRLGIPLVLEMNGNIVREIDEIGIEMSATQRRLGREITYRTLMSADQIVVVSETIKRQLIDDLALPAEKMTVVTNGVDVDLFSRSYNISELRRRYHLGSGPVAAFVGSFQPWHGVEMLIESFRDVVAVFPNARLIVAGDGAGRAGVQSQIAAAGLQSHVVMTGRLSQQQVAEVLAVADVVAAPYPLQHHDIVGTPLKLLEYLAAGKAIVASTAPLHEIITDGVTGLRVSPASSDALAKGIIRLFGDAALRTYLGANARELGQGYSWTHVTEKLYEIFLSVLAIGKPRQMGAILPAEERAGVSAPG